MYATDEGVGTNDGIQNYNVTNRMWCHNGIETFLFFFFCFVNNA